MQTDLQPLKIYLDTCCLSRSFDDQTQTRIYQEAEFIAQILAQILSGHWHWIASDALVDEVGQISDLGQRLQIEDLINVQLRVRVENPYIWFQEMIRNEHT